MNTVLSAFGDSPRLFRLVQKVMKCTKDEDVDKDVDDLDPLNLSSDDTDQKRMTTSKVMFVMMAIVLLVFSMGRNKVRAN